MLIYTSKPRTHHAGSHHWGLHRGAQLPLQVFCGSFYMGKFNAETPKRHKLWSNDRALLEGVVQKAGYMPREEQNKCPGQTTKKYVDRKGVKRHVGIKDALRNSQLLDWASDMFIWIYLF